MTAPSIGFAVLLALAGLTTSGAEAQPARNGKTSSPAATGEIVVDVSNLRSGGGSVLVALFDKARNFPSFRGQVAARRIAVSGDSARVVFEQVPYGRYAIAVVHDENDNGRLDTRLGVIPAEPIGFSNGARIGRFGPPSYEAAVFLLESKQRTVRIAVE